jgi:hypothetical protein
MTLVSLEVLLANPARQPALHVITIAELIVLYIVFIHAPDTFQKKHWTHSRPTLPTSNHPHPNQPSLPLQPHNHMQIPPTPINPLLNQLKPHLLPELQRPVQKPMRMQIHTLAPARLSTCPERTKQRCRKPAPPVRRRNIQPHDLDRARG